MSMNSNDYDVPLTFHLGPSLGKDLLGITFSAN